MPGAIRKMLLLSTCKIPSGVMVSLIRSRGLGAGLSKLVPSRLKPLPWQGHLNLFYAADQLGVQPRWVQMGRRA